MVDKPVIVNPKWMISGQVGCCGIGTIFRLGARDCTLSHRKAAQDAWYTSKDPKAIGSDMRNWAEGKLKYILQSTTRRPRGTPYDNHTASRGPVWQGAAVPATWAFAAVLEDLLQSRYAIYVLSDNMGEHGDVHLGSFSTKNFARWLLLSDAGQFQATGPIESLRTRRMIQGWLFTPNWKVMERLCEAGRTMLISYYKELNNDERIKSPEQDRLRARAADTANLVAGFTSGAVWSSTATG